VVASAAARGSVERNANTRRSLERSASRGLVARRLRGRWWPCRHSHADGERGAGDRDGGPERDDDPADDLVADSGADGDFDAGIHGDRNASRAGDPDCDVHVDRHSNGDRGPRNLR